MTMIFKLNIAILVWTCTTLSMAGEIKVRVQVPKGSLENKLKWRNKPVPEYLAELQIFFDKNGEAALAKEFSDLWSYPEHFVAALNYFENNLSKKNLKKLSSGTIFFIADSLNEYDLSEETERKIIEILNNISIDQGILTEHACDIYMEFDDKVDYEELSKPEIDQFTEAFEAAIGYIKQRNNKPCSDSNRSIFEIYDTFLEKYYSFDSCYTVDGETFISEDIYFGDAYFNKIKCYLDIRAEEHLEGHDLDKYYTSKTNKHYDRLGRDGLGSTWIEYDKQTYLQKVKNKYFLIDQGLHACDKVTAKSMHDRSFSFVKDINETGTIHIIILSEGKCSFMEKITVLSYSEYLIQLNNINHKQYSSPSTGDN